MTALASPRLITTEEFMAMPDDGIERDLIRGEIRERGMTRRNQLHSATEPLIASALVQWLRSHPAIGGRVFSGEAGIRLLKHPETTVGIDVCYVSADVMRSTPADSTFVDGPPVLAVEVLSPSDRQEEIFEKLHLYLKSGVKLVWIVEPLFQTIMVYRPDAPPELFNTTQHLEGEPHLPGFRVRVSELFS